MTINVTQECINHGVPDACFGCPIALAMMADPGITAAEANWDFLSWWSPSSGNWERCKTPESARNFIDDFDASKPVAPFSFELTPETRA